MFLLFITALVPIVQSAAIPPEKIDTYIDDGGNVSKNRKIQDFDSYKQRDSAKIKKERKLPTWLNDPAPYGFSLKVRVWVVTKRHHYLQE